MLLLRGGRRPVATPRGTRDKGSSRAVRGAASTCSHQASLSRPGHFKSNGLSPQMLLDGSKPRRRRIHFVRLLGSGRSFTVWSFSFFLSIIPLKPTTPFAATDSIVCVARRTRPLFGPSDNSARAGLVAGGFLTAIGATFGLSPFPEVGRRMFTWWLRALPPISALVDGRAFGATPRRCRGGRHLADEGYLVHQGSKIISDNTLS